MYRHGDDRWGGPGQIRHMTDDGGPSGPGEAEEEDRLNELVRRRDLYMEETLYKKVKQGGGGSRPIGGGGCGAVLGGGWEVLGISQYYYHLRPVLL